MVSKTHSGTKSSREEYTTKLAGCFMPSICSFAFTLWVNIGQNV